MGSPGQAGRCRALRSGLAARGHCGSRSAQLAGARAASSSGSARARASLPPSLTGDVIPRASAPLSQRQGEQRPAPVFRVTAPVTWPRGWTLYKRSLSRAFYSEQSQFPRPRARWIL
ncbi:hypothetical protein NDU88_005447 [Pleurodeles waltl]|uniref:Uncharacterized protein n=1 Tax=Pleurodeles waltl TaxID=8319 RepID=A0AAV7L333_PLEWA|nr:hypothetical protein NDU88_005447 [Pleurodeles waltl]